MNLINPAIRKLEARLLRKLERYNAAAVAPRAASLNALTMLLHALLLGAALAVPATVRADTSIYTEVQAKNGERLYNEHCAGCHGANLEGNGQFPALAGKAFLERCLDNGHTVEDLLFIMRSFMPYNAPGKLTKQEYADIMAYMLKVNGIAPDAKALNSQAAELQKVLLSMNP